jgi:tetratricopeptide (TPR) repeat protein
MIGAKQHRDAPRVTTLLPQAPTDLAILCDALLARAPAQRPDAVGLRAQLGRAGGVSAAASSLRTPSSAAPRVAATSDVADAAAAFLGRESELQALRDAHAAAVAGQAVVLFVAGESGMGKSALVTHFLDGLRAHGQATVLAGRCYERENVPFKGFDSVVDDLSRHLRKQSHAEASALMPREVFALARVFPVLDRIDAVARSPKKDIPDPHDLKRRAFDAFGELLGRLRDRSPLVVFIDDVQWLDQDSVRFMRALFVNAHPVPLLLVCAHRSEGADSNPLLQSVRQAVSDNPALQLRTLDVGPLPTSALVTLAARLLPSGTAAGAAQAFADEARGSPFFAAELARAAALRVPGAAPPSLAEAISLHVAALPLSAQRLLSLLALAGQPLPPDLAIEAVGLSDGHSLLDQLRSEQLVRVSIDGDGERSVECYHDKIREHVAGTLDGLGVRELSLGLSRALLAQAEPDAELLARCLHLAGEPAQAAVHAARAAEAAFSALAFERAVQLYADALQHGRFEPERELALRVGHARALAHAGQGERAAEAYLEAANGTPDAEAARELTRLGAEQYLMCGNLARGRAVLGQVLRAVGLSLPQSLPGTLASVAFWRTRLRLRGLSFTPRTEHDPATLRQLDALRTATHGLVRTDAALASGLCARWVLCALQAGHALELARALAWELFFSSMMGAPEASVAEADALCARLCEQTKDALARHVLFYCRGIHKALKLNDIGSALADFDRALEALAAHPNATSSYDAAWSQYWRATSLALLGRVTEAGELAHAQIDAALARGDHTVSVMLLQPAVFSLLAAGRPEQAERLLEQAIELLRPGEVTLQDMIVSVLRATPAMYEGRALDGWKTAEPLYKRFVGSFLGRVIMRGMVEFSASGTAAAAALQTEDPAERRRLTAQAKRFAKGARLSTMPVNRPMAGAVHACLRGDRAGAIAGLRGSVAAPLPPLYAHCLRRRLGEMLGDDEGHALTAEADAALRAGGVVDPARFTAAFMPGIEIR